jgi:Cu+-exporting ATPase
MKKLFKINGIDCLQCKFTLESALSEIKGVSAEIDIDKEIATIEMPTGMSDDVILDKITKTGYDGILL